MADTITSPAQLLAALSRHAQRPSVRIGEALLALGLIDERQLGDALQQQTRQRSMPLGELLVQQGIVSRDALQTVLAQRLGYPLIDASRFPPDAAALAQLPAGLARKLPALPLLLRGDRLVVALDDPSARLLVDEVELACGLDVVPVLAAAGTLAPAIALAYGAAAETAAETSAVPAATTAPPGPADAPDDGRAAPLPPGPAADTARGRTLAHCGLAETVCRRFAAALDQPQGLVLCAAPPGQGLSTLLDAAQRQRQATRPGEPAVRFDLVADAATATAALQAARDGAAVLAGLRARDSAEALDQLRGFGLAPAALAPLLHAVLVQRLLRRWCRHCVQQRPAAGPVLHDWLAAWAQARAVAGLPPEDPQARHAAWLQRHADGGRLWQATAAGCVHCHGSGMAGRVAVHELLETAGPLRRRLQHGTDGARLRRNAWRHGMRLLPELGFDHLLAGELPLAELRRL